MKEHLKLQSKNEKVDVYMYEYMHTCSGRKWLLGHHKTKDPQTLSLSDSDRHGASLRGAVIYSLHRWRGFK